MVQLTQGCGRNDGNLSGFYSSNRWENLACRNIVTAIAAQKWLLTYKRVIFKRFTFDYVRLKGESRGQTI